MQDYQASGKTYKQVQKLYTEVEQTESTSSLEKILRINDDTVGWIEIENTNIHYPVVQAKDNHYYLTHNFYKKEDFVGAIFMDYHNRTNQLDQNIIIYGHNMKDNSMFGSLKNYLDSDYYQENQIIKFDFLGYKYRWEIFSAYNSIDTDWLKTKFQSEASFRQYIKDRQQASIIDSQVTVDLEDTILTLSTCTNGDERERVIVHAKLMKEDNKIEE